MGSRISRQAAHRVFKVDMKVKPQGVVEMELIPRPESSGLIQHLVFNASTFI